MATTSTETIRSWNYLFNGNSDEGYSMTTMLARVLSVCPPMTSEMATYTECQLQAPGLQYSLPKGVSDGIMGTIETGATQHV